MDMPSRHFLKQHAIVNTREIVFVLNRYADEQFLQRALLGGCGVFGHEQPECVLLGQRAGEIASHIHEIQALSVGGCTRMQANIVAISPGDDAVAVHVQLVLVAKPCPAQQGPGFVGVCSSCVA